MNIRKSQCFSDKKGKDTKMCCLKSQSKESTDTCGRNFAL